MLEYKKGINFLIFPYSVRKFHSVFGWKCIRYSQQQYNNREERRMNKWKKLTSLALVGIMAGSLAACGGAGGSGDSGSSGSESSGGTESGAESSSKDSGEKVKLNMLFKIGRAHV